MARDRTRRSGYVNSLCVFADPSSKSAQHRPCQQVRASGKHPPFFWVKTAPWILKGLQDNITTHKYLSKWWISYAWSLGMSSIMKPSWASGTSSTSTSRVSSLGSIVSKTSITSTPSPSTWWDITDNAIIVFVFQVQSRVFILLSMSETLRVYFA